MAFFKRITEINLYNSLENEVLRWRSVATIFFDCRLSVLVFLAIFMHIWHFLKIVQGTTLQNVHQKCKQINTNVIKRESENENTVIYHGSRFQNFRPDFDQEF